MLWWREMRGGRRAEWVELEASAGPGSSSSPGVLCSLHGKGNRSRFHKEWGSPSAPALFVSSPCRNGSLNSPCAVCFYPTPLCSEAGKEQSSSVCLLMSCGQWKCKLLSITLKLLFFYKKKLLRPALGCFECQRLSIFLTGSSGLYCHRR